MSVYVHRLYHDHVIKKILNKKMLGCMCNISSFTVNNEFFLFLPIINYPMWVRDIHHIEGFLLASHLSFSLVMKTEG